MFYPTISSFQSPGLTTQRRKGINLYRKIDLVQKKYSFEHQELNNIKSNIKHTTLL